MLILPIKRKWFDMILRKEKLEEYREIKPYWTKRFAKDIFGVFPKAGLSQEIAQRCIKLHTTNVIFRNGYRKNSPQMECHCMIKTGAGKAEWGAEPNKEYYILEILEILEVQNVK